MRGLSELCSEATSPDNVFGLMSEGWALQALAHISRISEGGKPQRTKAYGGLSGRSMRLLEEYVLENLAQPISLSDMSNIAGLSKRHFLRAFQESAGVTPYGFVMSRRVENAKRRLAEGTESVTDIALATGFGHAQHFSTSFKKATGLTPTSYRQRCSS